MSFILDALKKSENERQRRSGPALFELKVARPKSGLPVWAVALAALLVVNLGIIVWLFVRSPSGSQAVASQTPAAPSAAYLPTAGAMAPAEPALTTAPPAMAPATPAQPPQSVVPPAVAANESAEAGSVLGGEVGADDALNPDDFEPATVPSATAPAEPQVRRGTVEGLPTYDEAASLPGANLPALRLDLHVYAARPQDRFVMINMQRLREGDAMQEGVRVETITNGGAVLSFRGSRFVLDRN